jgi:hypothetical protein
MMHRLLDLGVPEGLVKAASSFYDSYVARLRIGTRLTMPYFITTGTLQQLIFILPVAVVE